MAGDTFMDKVRSFFGLRAEPPRNDFRNPIWNTDDDDDDDELYTKQQIDVFEDPMVLHREFTKQMQEMFNSFGSMFGDVKTFFHDGAVNSFITDIPHEDHEDFNNTNSIRDYYLKPGYHNKIHENQGDVDLDGKISSNEIASLLKQKGDQIVPTSPFNDILPVRSFCQTIITTTVTKPDGSIETRKIIKKGNEVVEETITTTEPNSRDPVSTNINAGPATGIILSELASLFKNFY
ncbi:unnamed protein product [Parnassius apollo]|uniref:(apollo) hypothetical protein n=1 Tax=Parnassius apollo TaxID=110799 RepID=A0A8S3WPU6_PARAO|nr:unnamed protein product [Parnassius apollo]